MILRTFSTPVYIISALFWILSTPSTSAQQLHTPSSNNGKQQEVTVVKSPALAARDLEHGPPGDSGTVLTMKERLVDVSVWEGQSIPMRVRLDPQIFASQSTTGDAIASAGPLTYSAKLDASSTPATAASSPSAVSSLSTALPSWLKFDPQSIEFTGVPPTGTYTGTTYLTVIVSASSVPGILQATDQFTIQVNVHTLALSTSPSRSCSSSALFFAGSLDSGNSLNQRQDYLPDIVVNPVDKRFRFEITPDLFRIDGCTAPSMPPSSSRAAGSGYSTAMTPNGSTGTLVKNDGTNSNSMAPGILPGLTQLTVSLSTETAQQLSFASNAGLPSWLSFDPLAWILSGTVPAQITVPKLVLEIHTADNLNISKTFKLQIFTNSTLTPLFAFDEPPVADLWTKTGERFDMDMDLGTLLGGKQANASISSQFWFEMVDLSDRGQNLTLNLDRTNALASRTAGTRLTVNHSTVVGAVQVSNNKSMSCGINQLWNQQQPGAIFPTWFNHSIPGASTDNGLKVRLSGLVPCGVVLRVRWIIVNALGQWTSAEFLILASESGPPPQLSNPSRKDKSGGDDKLGPVGIKIAIGFALGIPVVLLLWFIGRKYCGPPRKEPLPVENKQSVLEDSSFQPRNWSRISVDGLAFGYGGHHRQHTSEVVIHPDSEYRSSYEDDPSVGHRDSYSEKYVAENSRTHSSSGEEGEGGSSSSQSQRVSVMGWIFNKEEKAALAAMHAQTLNSDPYQRPVREPNMFNLRRLSMGYPFESNRFGFISGSGTRHSLYDAGTVTGASTTGAGVGSPSGESHTTANDNYDHHDHEHLINHHGPSTTIDMPSELGTTGSTTATTPPAASGPPLRPAKNPSRSLTRGLEKRGGPRQKKQLRATASAVDLADLHLASLGPLPPLHSPRPCHSFASSGTGYMASMSAGNTSIEDDALETDPPSDDEDTRHYKEERIEGKQKQNSQQEDDEEEAKNRRRLSRSRLQAPDIQDPDYSVRISWTPNQFPLETAMTITDEDTNNATNNDDDYMDMKTDWIPRSDSGAIVLGSNRSPSSTNVDSMRQLHTASNSSASSSGTPSPRNQSLFPWGKLRSAMTPSSSRPASGLKKRVDPEGSAGSSISVQTAPQEKAQIQGRQQLSVQTSSLHQRRSIVELIQSKEGQVSPLSALSASLPFQDTLAVPAQDGEKDGDTKWMSVQCNYPVRSVSAGSTRRAGGKDDHTVEKMSDEQTHGLDDGDDDPGSVKDSDPRHFSLQSELGIIEHQPSPPPPDAVTVTPRQPRPLSAPMLSHQNISFRPTLSSCTSPSTPSPLTQSRVHALSGLGRQSSDRARPISYPVLVTAPPAAAAAPRSFVKATIGTAFHHTALFRNGSPSSPYTSPRTSMHVRGGSNGSLLNYQSLTAATSTLGEYRAYLVADPNDLAAQEALPSVASRHRSSSSLSSIDFGDQEQKDRPKRKLPDWIQFNNKMRSLWGRPTPGSAGEWHVSLVQSRMVDVPGVPAAILPQPPATAASSTVPSNLGRNSFSALRGDASAIATATATATAATTPTTSLFQQPSVTQKHQEEREVQVELVMLLVREPGEIPPKTPPLGATRWGSPLQFGGPGSHRPSFEVPSARPSLDLNSCVDSTVVPAAPCTPSPLVRVVTNTDVDLSSAMMDPTTPTPSAIPPQPSMQQEKEEPLIQSEFFAKSQDTNQQLPVTSSSPDSSSTLAPSPISPKPAPVIPAPTRTVGQRVLAERRRIEAAMQLQQQQQQKRSHSGSGNSSSISSGSGK
ncbi:hypothetical protein EMPS_08550 [Entomortierella parvispora]|uniref:Dystroglycan-type cadherin-like domain-containing protein n=1 Tax=Entomortierella parvispora TaxID=205924 RepID=A0A9P3HGL1_9FUNG|nr:hypothetical protein EMPS_08550 [Entomortierella parvispora]